MIAIVDLQSIGRDHIPFNTAFLRILRRTVGGEKAVMVCREDHRQAIADVLVAENVDFLALPDRLHHAPRGRLAGYDERDHFAFVSKLCADLGVDHLILLGVRADMLERVRRKPPAARVDVLFHATLAEPLGWRSRNPLRRRLDMFGVLGRRFPSSVRLIFLEEGIADQAAHLLHPRTLRAVMPHPILALPGEDAGSVPGAAIDVGFLGESNPGKGFEHFLALARRGVHHLRLHCVGRKGAHYDVACDPLFATPPAREKLDQADFDRLARANDLIFLPLDPPMYDLVASGTLLDCVRFAIPPVVPRNAVVTAIEQRYGRFAFIVPDQAAAIDLVSGMTPEALQRELPHLRQTLRAIAADRTVEAVARQWAAMTAPAPGI